MATKKSVEALQKSLSTLDQRIETAEQQLRRYRESRKKLTAQINAAQADELLGILKEREIPFEAAKDILAAAKQFESEEEENHE